MLVCLEECGCPNMKPQFIWSGLAGSYMGHKKAS